MKTSRHDYGNKLAEVRRSALGGLTKTGRLVTAVKAFIPALVFIMLLVLPSCFIQPAYAPFSGATGSLIAFNSNRDGNFEIYVMNADGTSVTRLTTNNAYDREPAWSPDGSKIAFVSRRDGNYEIYVMNANGSGQTNLSHNSADDADVAWSPGSKIAFASNRDGNWEVYVMNANGSGQTRLTNNPAVDGYPTWSPDGSKIAFRRWDFVNDEIYVMNADGSGQINISHNSAADQFPDWQHVPVTGYYSVDVYVKDATNGQAIEGALVFLDGVPRDYSNVMGLLTVTGVGSGTHTATASKTGYSALVVTFSMTRSTSVTVPLTPIVVSNTVTVQVRLDGTLTGIASAMVYVDGAYAGTTNTAGNLLLTLSKGTHTFTVMRSGYITKTQTETLAGSGPWTVTIQLAPR